jgi:hypothetical protein
LAALIQETRRHAGKEDHEPLAVSRAPSEADAKPPVEAETAPYSPMPPVALVACSIP